MSVPVALRNDFTGLQLASMPRSWFGDEARIGQKNKITRRWAKRGTRPSAPRDQRTASAYIFGAICPQPISTPRNAIAGASLSRQLTAPSRFRAGIRPTEIVSLYAAICVRGQLARTANAQYEANYFSMCPDP